VDISEKEKKLVLSLRIERCGFEMTPCPLCARSGRRCIVDSMDATRCVECVHQGKECGVLAKTPSLSEWCSIDRSMEKLQQEEEEAMAKILRLRRQQALLRRRRDEMIKRGLRSLDELDAVEEEERQREENQAKEMNSVQIPSTDEPAEPAKFDPFAYGVPLPYPDDARWSTIQH